MTKITGLPLATVITSGDIIAFVLSSGPTTQRITLANFIASISPASLLRRAPLAFKADESGGAVSSNNEGAPEMTFSGTPSAYCRATGIVPMDYATGTTAVIKFLIRTTGTNNGTWNYYVGARKNGDSFSSWNVQNNITSGSFSLTNGLHQDLSLYTIPAANLSAGGFVALAARPTFAISGAIYVVGVVLEYTSIL